MKDEALHVKLVIGNLLECNFNQQITLPIFVLLTLHAKLASTKIFLIKHHVVVLFVISISLNFYLLPCVKSKVTWCCFFASGHRLG